MFGIKTLVLQFCFQFVWSWKTIHIKVPHVLQILQQDFQDTTFFTTLQILWRGEDKRSFHYTFVNKLFMQIPIIENKCKRIGESNKKFPLKYDSTSLG